MSSHRRGGSPGPLANRTPRCGRYAGGVHRYFTPRSIGMHVTLLLVIPTFAWLTWWQFERAYHGNTVSWAYTFEWPLFGGYAIYVWWQLIHDDPTVFVHGHTGERFGADGEPLGPQEEPGWALGGGRRAKRRASRAELGSVTGTGPLAGTDTLIDSPVTPLAATKVAAPKSAEDDGREEEDPELAEYNRYLADLNASSDRKRW